MGFTGLPAKPVLYSMTTQEIPHHVAVIMDGNGRWAKARFLPRVEGHRRGMQALRTTIAAARKAGITHLSVFAFSSENWNRPQAEVQTLMRYFVTGLRQEAGPLADAGICLKVVGDVSAFSPELQEAIREAESKTFGAEKMRLNVCANYSGRWDIAQAASRAALLGGSVTSKTIEQNLCMAESGPVDLMIRTGGESRISNFILWQSAYAELWFTDTLWPDFSEQDLTQALTWYAGRERRFGRTGDQVKNDRVRSN